MDGRLIRTYCNEAGDYVVPNVLSPRDLVSRPDNMDETVLSSCSGNKDADQLRGFCFRICKNLVFSWRGLINILLYKTFDQSYKCTFFQLRKSSYLLKRTRLFSTKTLVQQPLLSRKLHTALMLPAWPSKLIVCNYWESRYPVSLTSVTGPLYTRYQY